MLIPARRPRGSDSKNSDILGSVYRTLGSVWPSSGDVSDIVLQTSGMLAVRSRLTLGWLSPHQYDGYKHKQSIIVLNCSHSWHRRADVNAVMSLLSIVSHAFHRGQGSVKESCWLATNHKNIVNKLLITVVNVSRWSSRPWVVPQSINGCQLSQGRERRIPPDSEPGWIPHLFGTSLSPHIGSCLTGSS